MPLRAGPIAVRPPRPRHRRSGMTFLRGNDGFESTYRCHPEYRRHPERSEGSRSLHHRHAPRRDASAVGLSMTNENGHPALFPTSSPRRRGSSPQVSLDSRLRGNDGFELTCSRIAPQVPCHPERSAGRYSRASTQCCHPERSEGSRSSHHRHAPRRDASAVGLSMTIEACHPEYRCHPERSEGSRSSHHRRTPRRDASAVGLSMTTEGCHSALLSRHPRACGDPVRKCRWIPAFAGMTFELTCIRYIQHPGDTRAIVLIAHASGIEL